MRYLAIDHGQKRTGLAVCDGSETICSPYAVLTDSGRLIEEIVKIINFEQIEAVVVGLPVNMDGTEGGQARLAREFGSQLSKKLTIPVHLHDERLSTFQADEKLDKAEFTKARKRKLRDAVAAANILESFLESKL